MLVIRFARTGRRNKAQFRIVLQEHTMTPTGKSIEILGSWNPHQKEGTFNAERINYWLRQGAKASNTVHNLLVSQKIIDDKKRIIKISKKRKKDEKDDNNEDDNNQNSSENNDGSGGKGKNVDNKEQEKSSD